MGRWSYSNKIEADNLKKVEIWWLKRHGYIGDWKPGGMEWNNSLTGKKSSISFIVSTGDYAHDNYIRFQYTQTKNNGEKKEFDYEVKLTTTPCNYGGVRYWFICPLVVNGQYCGKRVGVLYKSGDYFGCRHCYNLTYASRKLSGKHKAFGKITSIPEFEEMEKSLRCKYYKGKMTKRYATYLKKRIQTEKSLCYCLEHLYK